ncbi:MAG: phosphoribosylaminoimidazolesuccinocarboxamide synthase [Rickettsiales bacterium]|jgi:phosphoribosylaminoimidazole-succinocarboxamide synthase|nr:phosphoribosylaminoimidazolesuccinocarboxamide synthase [Rickettsiales bacterium]
MNNFPSSLGAHCRGKVRDTFKIERDKMLIITSDRISAFDIVLNPGIPGKGIVLMQISNFWMQLMNFPNHLIDTDIDSLAKVYPDLAQYKEYLRNRIALVKRLDMLPVEVIVRGYLTGSALNEYNVETGMLFGLDHYVGKNLIPQSKLPAPIYTPTTKAEQGQHDQPLSRCDAADICGAYGFSSEISYEVEDAAIDMFASASNYMLKNGLILADTKYEFGTDENGVLVLGDEILTPDSSRFWESDDYERAIQNNTAPKSYDKQPVRDYLTAEKKAGRWDGKSQPTLPDEVVSETRSRYIEAYLKIAGEDFNPSATMQLLMGGRGR